MFDPENFNKNNMFIGGSPFITGILRIIDIRPDSIIICLSYIIITLNYIIAGFK
jgi:hypothetical protein